MPKQSGFNGREYIVDINGSGGAYTPILAPGPTRYVKAIESVLTAAGAANVPQGITYLLPNDATTLGFGQALPLTVNNVLEIGDYAGTARSDQGSLLGNGPGVLIGIGATPATTLFMARSATVTPTSLLIRFDY